jgi:hypothetical protein
MEVVFVMRGSPDFPVHDFVRGKLGVLQPDYARMYLVVAYRYLSGARLNATEQTALLAQWERPLAGDPGSTAQPRNWLQDWSKRRDKILGKPAPGANQWWWGDLFGVLRWVQKSDTSFGYYNCLPDAFRNAVERFDQHARQFGETSAEVRDWVSAQEQVFANCSAQFGEKPHPPTIPGELPATAPAVLRADRAYQIAAANFYAGQLHDARQQFEAIAQDASSPWREIAPYLAARAVLRQATLNNSEEGYDADALAEAQPLFKKVLEDPSDRRWHESAQGLLSYIEVRLHPRERLHELSAALAKPGTANLTHDLTDYTYLMDHFAPNWTALREGDDMTDWIVTMQAGGPQECEHAFARWRRTSSMAWLVAALLWMDAPSSGLEPLLTAAAKVPPDSPAYAAATFHRLRLLAASGKTDDARTGLDAVLASQKDKLPQSSVNLLLALRTRLARNLEEFLSYAVRTPAGVSFDGTNNAGPWATSGLAREKGAPQGQFDVDAAGILNRRLPLALLAGAAQSQTLPAHLRQEVAIAAWTRAALLGDAATGRALARVLADLVPEMKTEMDAYAATTDAPSAKFTAAFAMLRFPGAQLAVHTGLTRALSSSWWGSQAAMPPSKIDALRDNWWCQLSGPEGRARFESGKLGSESPLSWVYPEQELNAPAFLTPGAHATANEEWQRLSTLPAAPNYFSGVVVAWARKHPDDPRVPEALHLVVRATRYGCTDGDSGKYSKAAFELLHARYPKSEWAKKTPYWFN